MADKDPSTLELLIGLKDRSKGAFEILYTRFAGQFYWRARRRGLAHEDADEVVDDTFMRILAGIHTFDSGKGTADAWMVKICYNAVIDKQREVLRRISKTVSLKDDGEEEPDRAGIGPEESAEQVEIDQHLHRSFEMLPAADQAEILRGRGRGPERHGWRNAMNHWENAFRAHFEGVKT